MLIMLVALVMVMASALRGSRMSQGAGERTGSAVVETTMVALVGVGDVVGRLRGWRWTGRPFRSPSRMQLLPPPRCLAMVGKQNARGGR